MGVEPQSGSAPETLAAKLARIRAEKAARVSAAPPQTPTIVPDRHDADLIPDVPEGAYERTDADREVDRVIDNIGVVEAYVKYIGKMVPKAGRKRESIMVSCPKPEHPDRNPSAWLNSDTDTWFCGTCDEGGDKFDFFAWHFGFPVPGYKEGEHFVALRQKVAEDNGVVTVRDPLSGKARTLTVIEDTDPEPAPLPTTVIEPDEPAVRAPAAPAEPTSDSPATVTSIPTALTWEDEDEIIDYPTVNWRTLAPTGTFLHEWMEQTSKDDLPDEFYFWLGMQALGFAIGRETELGDNPHVRGNLFLCLYGGTGMGKSRATGHLTRLLREALPYDHEDTTNTGTYLMPSPGSAEALVDGFSKPV